jgi:hypothetical protein
MCGCFCISIEFTVFWSVLVGNLMCAYPNMMGCGESAKLRKIADLQTLMLSTITKLTLLTVVYAIARKKISR